MRVLLVDDEVEVLRPLALVLERLGHTVDQATSGEEGLQRATLAPPDLVVTDIRMPGMDGLELVRQLRDRWPQLRVIIVSGYISQQARAAANAAGVTTLLPKPLDLRALLAAMGAVPPS